MGSVMSCSAINLSRNLTVSPFLSWEALLMTVAPSSSWVRVQSLVPSKINLPAPSNKSSLCCYKKRGVGLGLRNDTRILSKTQIVIASCSNLPP